MADAHGITERLEHEIEAEFPHASVVVEAEAPPASGEPEPVVEVVERVARRLGLRVHEVRAYKVDGQLNVTLHLEVDEGLSLEEAHAQATHLEEELQREIPGLALANTEIEPSPREPLTQEDQTRALRRVETVLDEMAEQLPEVQGVHDVQVKRTDGKLVVSLHCALNGQAPIGEAHRIGSQIEDRLKRELPDVETVLVHTEPEDAR